MSIPKQPATPETAELLQTVREALGLSVAQMAEAIGLRPDGGADNIRQMERGKRAVSGPVAVLLRYMAHHAGVTLRSVPQELAGAESTRVRLQGGKQGV
mgnify:CR=1 FL=1